MDQPRRQGSPIHTPITIYHYRHTPATLDSISFTMKFSAAIALAALTGANAFVAPQGSAASSTQLAMSDYRTSVRDNVDVGAGGSPLYKAGAGARDLAEIWDNSSPVIV